MRTYSNRNVVKNKFTRIFIITSIVIILYLISALNSFASEVDTLKAKQVGKNYILPLVKKN